MSKKIKIIKEYSNGCVLLFKKGGYYNVSKDHVLLGDWTMSLDVAETYTLKEE